MPEKLPPLWVSRIDRFLFRLANAWPAVVTCIIFVLCLIAAIAGPLAAPSEESAACDDSSPSEPPARECPQRSE